MLAGSLPQRIAFAIGLRLSEVILAFIFLTLAGYILSNFSEKYYIQKYASLSQNIETASLFLISPVYILGAALCSLMALNDGRAAFAVLIWIIPSFFMFLIHNIFSMGGLLPTGSLLASSILVISMFRLWVGGAK